MRLLSGGEDLGDALVADVTIRKDAHQAGARGGCAELGSERLIIICKRSAAAVWVKAPVG